LVDLERNTVGPLLDTPMSGTFRWAPTSESIVFANAYLPLDVADSTERRARAAAKAIFEVDVRTHRVTTIAHRKGLDIAAWDSATNTVTLKPETMFATGP